ncbi:MAG: 5'-deoxynucleotidase [Clostridia bacterium]|nr:5'-deoxynucleotidase [Clostridia bacterium]
MASHFYAYMARMKHIKRWGLRRNTREENDQEHSLMVAMIAHALAVLRNTRYAGSVDAGKVVTLAIYHEASEVITGDLASPIKYFNPGIKTAFKSIEQIANEKLLSYLPEDQRKHYGQLLFPDTRTEEYKLVKAADKISAYLKCVEELSYGNEEFRPAMNSLLDDIEKLDLPEVVDFMAEYAPSFSLTLDALN